MNSKTNHLNKALYLWLGFALSGLSLGIMIAFIISGKTIDQSLFYLLLLLFGVGISSLLFGVMKSFAKLFGKENLANYSFSGPIVGVILTVVGYYHFNPKEKNLILQFRVFNENNLPVSQGKLTLYLNDIIVKPINQLGQAQIQGISAENKDTFVKCMIISEGYEPFIKDSIQITDKIIEIHLKPSYRLKISGKILTAADIPISNVEVNIMNTGYYGVTRQDGSYSIDVKKFKDDKLVLVTSHENYQDKEVEIELDNLREIKKDLTLAPNSNPTGSNQ